MVRGGERPPCGWGCLLILRINIKKWSMLGGGVYQIGMPVCVCVCVCVCLCVYVCVCAYDLRRVGQNRIYVYTVCDRISGDFPAKHAVYTPYVYKYGSGQP